MASPTYIPIQTTTVGSAVSTVTLSSIPSTYTDLILVVNGHGAGPGAGGNTWVQVGNGTADTGGNYSDVVMFGNGSSTSTGRAGTSYAQIGDCANGDYFQINAHFMNYSNTTTYKTILSRSNAGVEGLYTSVWRNTSAINIITFGMNNQNVPAGCTLTLYGIAAA